MTKTASVFLSHTGADKAFARRLAADLKHRCGVRVWLDEAEMMVGDSLTKKVGSAIDEMDYLAVVLSQNSVDSTWVSREVAIAMDDELAGKQVKVLPLLFRHCTIPPFLRDKVYADFTDDSLYEQSLEALCRRLGASCNELEPDPYPWLKITVGGFVCLLALFFTWRGTGESGEPAVSVESEISVESEVFEGYLKACGGRNGLGCTKLGEIFLSREDETLATIHFSQACILGHARGCSNLGLMYEFEKVPSSYSFDPRKVPFRPDPSKLPSSPVDLYTRGCDGGDGLGCNKLGEMRLSAMDDSGASRLFTQACHLGYARGCSNLGAMFRIGHPVIWKNEKKAVELFEQACKAGDGLGCFNLGEMYFSGSKSTKVDEKKAGELFEQACEADEAWGCFSLGNMYRTGSKATKVDENKAGELFRRACAAGLPEGCDRFRELSS